MFGPLIRYRSNPCLERRIKIEIKRQEIKETALSPGSKARPWTGRYLPIFEGAQNQNDIKSNIGGHFLDQIDHAESDAL